MGHVVGMNMSGITFELYVGAGIKKATMLRHGECTDVALEYVIM